jgi:chorismate-pyruvate lyase
MAQTIEGPKARICQRVERAHPSLQPLQPAIAALELTRLQRLLLTTDGTVTDIVETYAGERVRVVKLFQDLIEAGEPIPDMDLEPKDTILFRKILLQGRISGANMLYAESVIVPDRLDEPIRDELLRCQVPIGHLIIKNRLETFRQILTWGKETAGPLSIYFDVPSFEQVVFRTYQIYAGGQPIMMITEKFPESYYLD